MLFLCEWRWLMIISLLLIRCNERFHICQWCLHYIILVLIVTSIRLFIAQDIQMLIDSLIQDVSTLDQHPWLQLFQVNRVFQYFLDFITLAFDLLVLSHHGTLNILDLLLVWIYHIQFALRWWFRNFLKNLQYSQISLLELSQLIRNKFVIVCKVLQVPRMLYCFQFIEESRCYFINPLIELFFDRM